MGIFDRNKKGFVDLTDYHKKQQNRAEHIKANLSNEPKQETQSSGGFFNMFGGANPASTASSVTTYDSDDDANEKKRRLAKRIGDMTDKLEELSNQLYHMQQRIEVIERKLGVNSF